MSAVIDLTDMRFGRLTVVGLHPERAHWERILREADVDAQVAAALADIETPDSAALSRGIKQLFEATPDAQWRDHIETAAAELAGVACEDPNADCIDAYVRRASSDVESDGEEMP